MLRPPQDPHEDSDPLNSKISPIIDPFANIEIYHYAVLNVASSTITTKNVRAGKDFFVNVLKPVYRAYA